MYTTGLQLEEREIPDTELKYRVSGFSKDRKRIRKWIRIRRFENMHQKVIEKTDCSCLP